MDDQPKSKADEDFERLVKEAKGEVPLSLGGGNILLNCICMIGTVVISVALASSSSSFLIIYMLAVLAGPTVAFGNTVAVRQAGRSILIGCFLGFVYLAAIGSRW